MAEQNPESNDEQSPDTSAGESAAAPDPTPGSESEATSEAGSEESTPSPEEALDAADRAAEQIKHETDEPEAGSPAPDTETNGEPLNLEDFTGEGDRAGAIPSGLTLLDDIDLQVTVELGRTRMYIEDVLRLNENSVVELDKAAGDSVDIYVNDRLVARGEVLVLNENFCVRINEIINQQALDECEAAGVNESAS